MCSLLICHRWFVCWFVTFVDLSPFISYDFPIATPRFKYIVTAFARKYALALWCLEHVPPSFWGLQSGFETKNNNNSKINKTKKRKVLTSLKCAWVSHVVFFHCPKFHLVGKEEKRTYDEKLWTGKQFLQFYPHFFPCMSAFCSSSTNWMPGISWTKNLSQHRL